jgi:hypothetical protein
MRSATAYNPAAVSAAVVPVTVMPSASLVSR